MSFVNYKKQRKKGVDSLINKLKDANEKKKKDFSDDRQYKYTKDKAGNAFAVLRFLPSKNDLPPIVSSYRHAFKNRGKWLIAGCPTSIKQKCPVCEDNNKFWGENATEQTKAIGRQRARKKEFFANVYVVKDSENPDIEGKVMIWKFGQKVYEKIMDKLQPEFEGEKPVDVFDLFEGANFKLNIKTVKGYSNYDKCAFLDPAPLFEDDKHLEEVYNGIYDLSEFIATEKFQSYDKLKERLQLVAGTSDEVVSNVEERVEEDETETETNTNGGDEETEDSSDDEYFDNLG